MTEENFEKFLRKTAQSYNAPPVRVPRDEMWAAIQAKRAAGPRVVYGGGTAAPVREKLFGMKVWLGAAAAAMLLVATGVGIGRWTASKPAPMAVARSTNGLQTSAVPQATNPEALAPEAGGAQPSATPPRSVATAGRESSAGAGRERIRENVVEPNRGPTRLANVPNVVNAPTSAYQLTAVQHLSEAEALLTSFRSRSSADQQMDAQLGTWARQLLTNTRLLLDSPVGDDPQRRPLLQDLELVLVQIVQQLSPGSTPQDRDLIEKTLQQDHVMTRLRTAIPAGAQHGS